MRPRKRFGQHFLKDPAVLGRISSALDLKPDQRLLEIGPGRGALTAELHGQPGRYLAVEIDRDLVPALKARFADIDFVNDDILRIALDELLSGGDWRVVGNLPYNISTPLLVRLFAHTDSIRDMHFMLQREVAQRLAAVPGTKAWGRLTVVAQYHCEVQALFDVDPTSFTPAPKVFSCVVRLVPHREKLPLNDLRRLDLVLRCAFSGRRKLITNALKSLDLPWDCLDVDSGARADQLSVSDFVALANAVPEEA
ncbi:MAG: 16S rRNA (adenine(1518)-N(6)/adenine(1519)-N(6))-dimethyltransferase RsmA [Pseudomonadales bacterium]|jgi:16S rRNA (adenine1518-N6/adenine1519-N6)-dimethyltransferase